jgi:hypothetical protein
MDAYRLFVAAINKQVEVLGLDDQPKKTDTESCPEISIAKTIEDLVSSVRSCFTAGGGVISSAIVVGMIVTKLGELAIGMIRSGSVSNWKDFFSMLCSFLETIIKTLRDIGVMSQFLANPALVQILVSQIVGKLGFLLGETFYGMNSAVFGSQNFKNFLRDLLVGGPNNISAFCRTVAQMTEEEVGELINTIMANFESFSAALNSAYSVLSRGLSQIDLRPALVLAIVAALGITLASGGTSTPITAPALAVLVAVFIMLGMEPPSEEELSGYGITIG